MNTNTPPLPLLSRLSKPRRKGATHGARVQHLSRPPAANPVLHAWFAKLVERQDPGSLRLFSRWYVQWVGAQRRGVRPSGLRREWRGDHGGLLWRVRDRGQRVSLLSLLICPNEVQSCKSPTSRPGTCAGQRRFHPSNGPSPTTKAGGAGGSSQ